MFFSSASRAPASPAVGRGQSPHDGLLLDPTQHLHGQLPIGRVSHPLEEDKQRRGIFQPLTNNPLMNGLLAIVKTEQENQERLLLAKKEDSASSPMSSVPPETDSPTQSEFPPVKRVSSFTPGKGVVIRRDYLNWRFRSRWARKSPALT